MISLVREFLTLKSRFSAKYLPKGVDAVWVLSGPEYDLRGENGARITFGLELARRLGAKYFIYNGVQRQNLYLRRWLAGKQFPFRLKLFACTNKLIGNTSQQFSTFWQQTLLKELRSLVIVSSWYHLPRVYRLAKIELPSTLRFWCTGPTGERIPLQGCIIEFWKITTRVSAHPRDLSK